MLRSLWWVLPTKFCFVGGGDFLHAEIFIVSNDGLYVASQQNPIFIVEDYE